jgi:hypothetical protein
MSEQKLRILAGLIRSIMELCMTALAILEPDEEAPPQPEGKPPPRYFGDENPAE